MNSKAPIHSCTSLALILRLNADASDAKLFTLDVSGTCTAEGIEYTIGLRQLESLYIVPHQMRRVRKDEAIPIVGGAVSGSDLVDPGIGYTLRTCHESDENRLIAC